MGALAFNERVSEMNELSDFAEKICVQKLNRRLGKIHDSENFQILWLEGGVVKISIDFEELESFPYSIIFLYPGQEVSLRFECLQPRGWILKFSHSFF